MTTLLPQAATEVTPPRTFPELAGHVRLLEAELIGRVMAAIRTRPTYSSLDERDLRPTVARHVRRMLEHFAAGGSLGAEDLAFFRHMGEQRARAGVSVRDLVFVWRSLSEAIRDAAYRLAGPSPERAVLLLRTAEVVTALDEGIVAMVSGFEASLAHSSQDQRLITGRHLATLVARTTSDSERRHSARLLDLPSRPMIVVRCRTRSDVPDDDVDRYFAEMDARGVVHALGWVGCDLCALTSDRPRSDAPIAIGVSDPAEIGCLPDAWSEAGRALDTLLELGRNEASGLADLGVMAAVVADGLVGSAIWRRRIEPLISAVADPEAILDTVGTYLDSAMSVRETADRLFLHPNTVRYRITRFEELSGTSLRGTADALVEVWWALCLRSLNSRVSSETSARAAAVIAPPRTRGSVPGPR